MRALAILVLLAAACGGNSDPCASVNGTCLALEVRGTVEVNALQISASDAVTEQATSVGMASSLPIQVAITFPAGVAGHLHLDVVGELNGAAAGEGSTDVMLVAGVHARATVTLGANGDLGVGDLSTDQSVPDLASFDATPACAVACINGSELQTCGEADLGDAGTTIETCTYGCIDDASGAHCAVFVPAAPVPAADVVRTDVLDVVTAATSVWVMNTDTGGVKSTLVRRDPNDMGTNYEVRDGVGFHVVGGVGVFVVKDLDIPSGATVVMTGTAAGAIVATNTITIDGILDARAYPSTGSGLCSATIAGPGGWIGGNGGSGEAPPFTGGTPGQGPGRGGAGDFAQGDGGKSGTGGGAGHGAAGGAGGGYVGFGGAGGMPYDITPPGYEGGSGGGGGGSGGTGGAGGGSVHLVAGAQILIGTAATAGGINVGGCGGVGGGGGGGSGGTILLEAPSLFLSSHGTLAANGGGVNSNAGTLDAMPADSGGAGDVCQGATGAGAAGLIYRNVMPGGEMLSPLFVLSPSMNTVCTKAGTITLE